MPESRARELRWQMTDAERVLWSILRRKQLERFRFRRQAPIGPFFADFFCPEARLIIEVDGGQHFEEDNVWRDYRRSKWIEEQGFRVIRFTNDAVFRQPADVVDEIRRVLLERAKPPFRRVVHASAFALRATADKSRARDTFPRTSR
jgi:very-short-patch-repair endonuclease